MINMDLTDRQKEYLETIPEPKRSSYIKALTTGSKPALIKAMCFHCVGYEKIVKNVHECRVEICPLYHVRPGANKELSVDDSPKPSVEARKVER